MCGLMLIMHLLGPYLHVSDLEMCLCVSSIKKSCLSEKRDISERLRSKRRTSLSLPGNFAGLEKMSHNDDFLIKFSAGVAENGLGQVCDKIRARKPSARDRFHPR